MSMERANITVSGRVQGVGFRFFVTQKARDLNISGTVKNEMNGTVSVNAEGEKDNIEQFIVHLYQGPSMARVDDIDTQWVEYTGKYQGFRTVG
ncbi:MAG: acylphosphatase [candidate division KSB1 bacterium]|nr:acylphosphatase [candidate division KSB1 bacterium]